MIDKYLKSFVIGSSFMVIAPFFYAVQNIPERKTPYTWYTLAAPLFLGTANMLSKYVGDKLNMSTRTRLFLTGLITATFVCIYTTIHDSYRFVTKERWYMQYLLIFVFHMFTFSVIIYLLEDLLEC